MAEETDGIEEAIEGQLRLLVTAAGHAGERIARAREDARHRAQAVSEQEARELASRLAAEQRAARTELAGVYRAEWWDRATPEQISRTYQVARAWSQEDPEAVRAEARMRDELRTRYGVNIDQTHTDPAAVREAMGRAERTRSEADAERTRAAAENAEAIRLLQHADLQDARAEQARAAEHEPDPADRRDAWDLLTAREQDEYLLAQRASASERSLALTQREDGLVLYDSAERRTATASDLDSRGIDQEVVATRMRADVSQATPADAAVRSHATSKSPSARKTRGRGRSTRVQRTDRSR